MNNTPFSIRLPEHIRLADVDAKAKKHGLTRAGFAVKAVELLTGFDDAFLVKIEEYANGLNIPLSLVMQNMLIKRLAQEAAEAEVWGPGKRLLDEFLFTSEGVITGQELFDMLKKNYLAQERQAYDEMMGKQIRRKEDAGLGLTAEEQEWLSGFKKAAVRVSEIEEVDKRYIEAHPGERPLGEQPRGERLKEKED